MQRKASGKIVIYSLAGILGLCVICFAALMLISGAFLKPKYLEPWDKIYSQKFTDPRVQLSSVGLLAPSNHNMQPWKIKLDPKDSSVFYLYADSTRMTDEVDPYARQMMVSQGTFLEYVSVAGQKAGYNVGIDLFPNGTYDEGNLRQSMDEKPVAKLTLQKATPVPTPLYDGMFMPDTNREAYTTAKPTAGETSALKAAADESGVKISVYDDAADRNKIGGYAMQSADIEANTARVMQESDNVFRSNEYQKNKYRYGYSVEGQGTSGMMKNIMQGLVTVFPSLNTGKDATKNFIDATRLSVDSTPAYAMIVSNDNSRVSQVRAGMVYSRLVLTGHSLGLAMQPLSQALEEYPEMKAPYDGIKRDYAPGGGTIQMLFRFGVPTKSTPLSMRRDVTSLLAD